MVWGGGAASRVMSDGTADLSRLRCVPAGRLNLHALEQCTWSVDVEQRPHRIEDMSWAYRRNVLGFLHAHVKYFHLVAIRDHLSYVA